MEKIGEPRLSSELHVSGGSVNNNHTGYNSHQAVVAAKKNKSSQRYKILLKVLLLMLVIFKISYWD
jgi:hypothetical protein